VIKDKPVAEDEPVIEKESEDISNEELDQKPGKNQYIDLEQEKKKKKNNSSNIVDEKEKNLEEKTEEHN